MVFLIHSKDTESAWDLALEIETALEKLEEESKKSGSRAS